MNPEPLRILIVEGDPKAAQLAELALSCEKPAGFVVQSARTLAEAFERLARGKPDAVLLDLGLPDSAGIETLLRVRAAAPRVPVVVLTAGGEEPLAVEAIQEGAQDYVLKGVADIPLLGRSLRYAVERKRAELREERLKDEFLHNVSHELKTPLTACIHAVELALETLPDAAGGDVRKILEMANRSAAHLEDMIDDLLDATRAQTGKLTFEPGRTALRDLLRDVVETEALGAAARGVTLADKTAVELPPVYADPVRVRQVLLNLIDNAIKFTPQGGSIRLEASLSPSDPGSAQVSVRDTGCGIPPEAHQDVFERLYQVRGGKAAGDRRGLGIGLYLCKQIVERQGGRIWVESRAGQGSDFLFTLPIFSLERLLAPVLLRDVPPAWRLVLLAVEVPSGEPPLSDEARAGAVSEARAILRHSIYPVDLLLPELRPGEEGGRVFVAACLEPGMVPSMARRIEAALAGAYILRRHRLAPRITHAVVELPGREAPAERRLKTAAERVEALLAER